MCELASIQGLSLGACSAPAEQSSGTVSGYFASPHPDSCGTVIFDHTPKPNENSHLGESFIPHAQYVISRRVYTRISVNARPLRVRDDVLSVSRETARPL